MTGRTKTPMTIEKIKRDFGSDYPMMFGALQAHCEIQERELTVAQALAEQYKRDAERYQKLRNNYIFNDYGNARLTFTWQAGLDGGGSYEATMDLRRAELDAAIDRAREGEK